MADRAQNAPAAALLNLLTLMAQLRDPDTGCPWDVQQDFASIAPYTIEEAYEVADAIARGDIADLRDELGDLLLQVVFHARIAEEAGHFDFTAVAAAISDKLVRRHPHVFGDQGKISAATQSASWESLKAAERAANAAAKGRPESVLDGVPLPFPALLRAYKLQRRAARVGFDWPELAPVAAKVEEEWAELTAEIDNAGDQARLTEEVGDLLFAVVNLARHLEIDPEAALRAGNAKFERRFRAVEDGFREKGRQMAAASLEDMEVLWNAAKASEKGDSGDI
ncbi:MAG: nucleoside triphosphate pyrophosphohydrolase [Nisaea sp.]|nr:nucleoside triphosphate pyrophosphohydrolase [Nisaea sp.]MEC8282321.1 nucleoside triphosphate pyrophosphohydrolase [Pseudomonadota bacterium]MEC8675005.1 nucleoside triphosphate pyrophosphohydrolase [Pseudomonadota bacterium]